MQKYDKIPICLCHYIRELIFQCAFRDEIRAQMSRQKHCLPVQMAERLEIPFLEPQQRVVWQTFRNWPNQNFGCVVFAISSAETGPRLALLATSRNSEHTAAEAKHAPHLTAARTSWNSACTYSIYTHQLLTRPICIALNLNYFCFLLVAHRRIIVSLFQCEKMYSFGTYDYYPQI